MHIDEVLKLTDTNEPYIYVDGKPIDARRPKYKMWKRMKDKGLLKCKCCGSEVADVRLVKTKGAGSIHKETGDIKYTFFLVNQEGSKMTFDHWIPKRFLKKKHIDSKVPHNLVLMCFECNQLKANMIPANWQAQYAINTLRW